MPTRRTRSASLPETRDERLGSLPPTYSVLATIPSQGFLVDPEALFRRRPSESAQRRTTRQEATTGIDATLNFLAYSLDAAPPAKEEETESDGEDDSVGQRDLSGDVDEGYQTGFLTAYETETDVETEYDAECLHTFTTIIDGPDYRRTVNPVPALPSLTITSADETTPTSPDPGTTPIQSPRPTPTVPLPTNIMLPRQARNRSHIPPLDISDDEIAVILHPIRGPAVADQSFGTDPIPSASSTTLLTLARSQRIPPGPQPTPPRRATVIAESARGLSNNNLISEDTDDDDDSDTDDDSDDEEEEGTAEQAANLRRGPASTTFRAPSSTEQCSITYTAIQSDLENYLDQEYPSFSTFLLIGCHGVPDSTVEIPFLFIALPPDSSFPSISSLPQSVKQCGIAVVVCHVTTQFGLGEETNRKLPRRHLVTGLAVGCHENKHSTTVGAIIRKTDGTYLGVTSGHLVDKGPVGETIIQPSMNQFKKNVASLRQRIDGFTVDIERARSSAVRDRLAIAQGKLEKEIKTVEEFIGNTDQATLSNLKAGVLVKRELKTAKFGEVRRVIDYLLFNIAANRVPGDDLWEYNIPTEGVLGDGTWATMTGWGALAWDLEVRKNGAATGFSFGVVAGISTTMKLVGNKPTHEYFIMPETKFAATPFAEPGDSGSGIIDRTGKLVGFVFARCILEDFVVLVHPTTGYLDLASMKRFRNEADGSIDYERAYFQEYAEINVTLVMCSSVLESRSGIQGMGDLVVDS